MGFIYVHRLLLVIDLRLGLSFKELSPLLILVVVIHRASNSISKVPGIPQDTKDSQTMQQICALNVPRTA